MRVEQSTTVEASPDEVWDVISDPTRYPELIGFSEWRQRSERTVGFGARYDVRMPVGSVLVGGLVEVVEFEPPGDMAWHSVTGIDHRGRWRVRQRDGVTTVTLRLTYQVPGGLLGLLAAHTSAPFVRRNLRDVLARLREVVDSKGAQAETR